MQRPASCKLPIPIQAVLSLCSEAAGRYDRHDRQERDRETNCQRGYLYGYVKGVGCLLLSSLLASHAHAGDVAVIDASIQCEKSGTTRVCSISATLEHDDTGWDHYADAWRVVTDDGTEIGRRVLMHPHENEQPFTRSESGIKIPEGVTRVYIEGQDNVHGLSSDNRFELAVPD